MEKVFDTPTPTSLYVELGSGALTLHTDDVKHTVVDVNGKEADEVLVEQRGGEIVVIAPPRRSGFFGTSSRDLDVHVSLPHNSRLRTKLGSADVRVMGNLAEAMIKSGSGDVDLDEVTDDAQIETGSGDISVARCGASIRAKAGSGDVSVEHVGGNAYLSTGSGDIEIGRAQGSVELKSGSGDMRVHEMQTDASLSTASGDLVVDLIHRGQLAARNVSGDITIGVAGGVPVWTDVNTVTGSVSSSLQGAGQPEEGQDHIELRAKTVSGDIYLEQR
jgi:DUF4097 and DUF4098 domain-containing protein YvlB